MDAALMDASGIAVGVACQAVVASEVAVAAAPLQRDVVALQLQLRVVVGQQRQLLDVDAVAVELLQLLPLQLQLDVVVAAVAAADAAVVGDASESLLPDDNGCHDASVAVAAEPAAAQRSMVAYRPCAVPSLAAAARLDPPMK